MFAGQSSLAFAQQNNELPPPPGYAQQATNNYGGNPFNNTGNRNFGPYPNMNRYGGYSPQQMMPNNNYRPQNMMPSRNMMPMQNMMPNNFRPNNFNNNGFRPNNFNPNNFSTPNFGPGSMSPPGFNSNDYPMPWNQNNNGSPMMSSQNLPMMNSKQWAEKVPDWGEQNGPYRNGPWATKQNQARMEGWWDDMINAPHDMGRMPGGWKAPSVSFPNPVDVSNQLGRQFDKLPGQVREMDVSN